MYLRRKEDCPNPEWDNYCEKRGLDPRAFHTFEVKGSRITLLGLKFAWKIVNYEEDPLKGFL